MTVITHLIQELSRGGGARATIYLAHYSTKHWSTSEKTVRHQIVSLKKADPQAIQIANEYGIEVIDAPTSHEFQTIIQQSDIVQVSWWNNTELYKLFTSNTLPPTRLMGWFHVGGQAAPQVLTNKLVDYFDIALACSPYTFSHPAFQSLPVTERDARTGMVYGATDFSRIGNVNPRDHDGFNIGYIGTVDFIKMHPDYVKMSAQANISSAQFLLCGSGEAVPHIMSQASQLGIAEQFRYLGYIEDVSSFLSIVDVYGYPLREDTYAASEMNLQEVMYAGIPVVVLPSGGIKDLVIDRHTGLICQNAQEYADALRFLYENPSERKRLGDNAKEYATKIFGAENAGKKVNEYYRFILSREKSKKTWGGKDKREDLSDRFIPSDVTKEGHILFMESLGSYGSHFLISTYSKYLYEQLRADAEIAASGEVLLKSGINAYKNEYPTDWRLQYWQALCFFKQKQIPQAIQSAVEAIQSGGDLRSYYLALAAAEKSPEGTQIITLLKPHVENIDTKQHTELTKFFHILG